MKDQKFVHNQRGFTHIFLILMMVVIIGVVAAFTYARINYTSDSTVSCGGLGQKVLDSDGANYPLHRCELEEFTTEDGTTITKVYAVAGEVEKRWEFECGFMAPCSTHTGWFDENSQLISFTSAPRVADNDPAVQAAGCGLRNVSSVYDNEVEATLTQFDGKYRWKVVYDNFSTSNDSSEKLNCRVNGTSYIGADDVQADLTIDYEFSISDCSVFDSSGNTRCRIAASVINGGFEDCRYDFAHTTDVIENHLDVNCAESYYSRTGDESICGLDTDFTGPLDCSRVVIVDGSLVGKIQTAN